MNAPFLIQDPDLRSLLIQHKQEMFFNLNCHQVGSIVSFDATNQTARVQLVMKRSVFNQKQAIDGQLQTTPQTIDYPVLVDCPVFVHTGGNARITFPVVTGDSCLVLFNDRDIDIWYATGTSSVPNSQRAHSLSDGFALVGFRNLSNKVTDYSETEAQLVMSGAMIRVKPSGNVEINSANGGFIQVEDKIAVSNAATSLKTVLDNLCSALTSWTDTRGDTPNTTTITAINAVKSLADSLLK